MTLVSAGPVVELSVTPPSAGTVVISTGSDVGPFTPVGGAGSRRLRAVPGLSPLAVTDNGGGSFTADLSGSTSLENGEQILVELIDDGNTLLVFTPVGAGLSEVDPSPLGGAFPAGDATLAAFDFVGAPSLCRCACSLVLGIMQCCPCTADTGAAGGLCILFPNFPWAKFFLGAFLYVFYQTGAASQLTRQLGKAQQKRRTTPATHFGGSKSSAGAVCGGAASDTASHNAGI